MDPRLLERYGLKPAPTPAEGEGAAGAPAGGAAAKSTNELDNVKVKFRAVNLNRAGDSSANGNLAFVVEHAIKASPYLTKTARSWTANSTSRARRIHTLPLAWSLNFVSRARNRRQARKSNMQWIKRNLFLVLGGVVALGLLGFAGFYLFAKIQQDQGVTGELDSATQKLETLAKRDPYPNPENIAAAKDEGKRLQSFLGDVEKHFQPAPYPDELNPMEFRTYLDNTRAKLLSDAHRAGVEVPTNYWFTFAAQKGAMTFSPATCSLWRRN